MSELSIQARIAQANGRLDRDNVGVKIELRGTTLGLRGTFPPRPGSSKTQRCQQRISLRHLGVRSNPEGVKEAEKQARKIAALLACREFSWEPYLKVSPIQRDQVGYWVQKFQENFYQRGGRETTWKGDYQKILKKLPQDALLTPELLNRVILTTAPNTKTRKRTCMVFGALSKLAGLDYDPSSLAGNYSPRRVSPRDLPDDKTLVEWYYKITNPAWRWVYGMLLTYGLRPHEVFKLDLETFKTGNYVARVLKDTKTGERLVWPCYPDWFDEFTLWEVQLPNVDLNRNNTALGASCTDYFRDKLPFRLYDIRHCWAVRTLEFGLDVTLAAQQMGHSVQVHTDTYHHWIKADVHQRAFNALINRPDRPKPPQIPP